MRAGTLTRMLSRLGLTLATRGPYARLRGSALAAGSMLLVLGLGGLVLAGAYASLRHERTIAVAPTPAASPSAASLLTSFDGFMSVGDRPVAVISIWPLGSDAPLPPGVVRWPQPGQAVLSPALLHDLGPSRADLFGAVAGTIGPGGLEVPTERRVYLRPTRAAFDTTRMQPATGFGHPASDAGYGVGFLYAQNGRMVAALVLAALVAPALVAIGLATSLDGDARDQRTRLLTALGAGRRHRAIVDSAEAGPAVLVGSALGGVMLAVMCAIDIRLPFLDAVLAADAARRVWPRLLLATVVGVLLAVLTVVAIRARPTLRRRRRRSALRGPARLPWLRTGVFAVALSMTIAFTWHSRSAQWRILAYIGGSLVVAVTLPAVLGVLLTVVGRAGGGWGLRHGSAGALAGGRRLQRFPHRTARLALGLCFGILLIGQVQLWSSALGVQYYQALDNRARL